MLFAGCWHMRQQKRIDAVTMLVNKLFMGPLTFYIVPYVSIDGACISILLSNALQRLIYFLKHDHKGWAKYIINAVNSAQFCINVAY